MASAPFQPGGARNGNFINYYSFHPPSERLKYMSKDLGIEIYNHCDPKDGILFNLDVGCNAGDLTVAFQKHLFHDNLLSSKTLAIDIDETLISRCCKTFNSIPEIEFFTLDIAENDSYKFILEYLEKYGRTKFDLITCFSTTMWIHLNNGDSNFTDILERLSQLTSYLLIEPQPWKCYRNASRRMRKLNLQDFCLSDIKIRNIDGYIKNYLTNSCQMRLIKQLGTTEWDRSILLFMK